MDFEVHHEERGGMPLFRVKGELDLLSAPRLLDTVQDALSDGAASIAFDLSELRFIDSYGISVLVNVKKQTAERGGRVYVMGVRGHIQRVFNLIQVGDQFCICEEEELPVA